MPMSWLEQLILVLASGAAIFALAYTASKTGGPMWKRAVILVVSLVAGGVLAVSLGGLMWLTLFVRSCQLGLAATAIALIFRRSDG